MTRLTFDEFLAQTYANRDRILRDARIKNLERVCDKAAWAELRPNGLTKLEGILYTECLTLLDALRGEVPA